MCAWGPTHRMHTSRTFGFQSKHGGRTESSRELRRRKGRSCFYGHLLFDVYVMIPLHGATTAKLGGACNHAVKQAMAPYGYYDIHNMYTAPHHAMLIGCEKFRTSIGPWPWFYESTGRRLDSHRPTWLPVSVVRPSMYASWKPPGRRPPPRCSCSLVKLSD